MKVALTRFLSILIVALLIASLAPLMVSAQTAITLDYPALTTGLNGGRSAAPLSNAPALNAAAQAMANDRADGRTLAATGTYLDAQNYTRTSQAFASLSASSARTTAQIISFFATNATVLNTTYNQVGFGAASGGGRFHYIVLVARSSTPVAGVNLTNTGGTDPLEHNNAVVTLVNHARNTGGLCTVTTNSLLIAAAQRHANDMARGDFLSHTGSDQTDVRARMLASGYTPITYAGENILSRTTINASGAFTQWWNSPTHQANIMNNNFTEIGVAFAGPSASGKYYYAMVLGNRGSRTGCEIAADTQRINDAVNSGNPTPVPSSGSVTNPESGNEYPGGVGE
jgi:uncharacterized protein YkwD